MRWGGHPERIVTHRDPLTEVGTAHVVADRGDAGTVDIVWKD